MSPSLSVFPSVVHISKTIRLIYFILVRSVPQDPVKQNLDLVQFRMTSEETVNLHPALTSRGESGTE